MSQLKIQLNGVLVPVPFPVETVNLIGSITVEPFEGERRVDITVSGSGSGGMVPSDILRAYPVALESPTNTENAYLFTAPFDMTIYAVTAVLKGSSSPSVTWQISHGTSRASTGNDVFTASKTTTTLTTPDILTATFDDATIPADSVVVLTTSATANIVDELGITIYFTEDP